MMRSMKMKLGRRKRSAPEGVELEIGRRRRVDMLIFASLVARARISKSEVSPGFRSAVE
jgi:hypothetical protein